PNSGIGGNGGAGANGGNGGGIHVGAPISSQLTNVTVAGNAVGPAGAGGLGGSGGHKNGSEGAAGSAGAGGGVEEPSSICGGGPCPSTTLANTIVASDAGGNCAGAIADGAHDLSFPDATCPGVNGDPVLGSLLDNGGPTKTIDLGQG